MPHKSATELRHVLDGRIATMYCQLAILSRFVRLTLRCFCCSANPWQGVNALDATVQGYTNVAMMRQQFKPSWRVHGVITDGGTEPNIIPAISASRWYIRAPNMQDLADLHKKVGEIFLLWP